MALSWLTQVLPSFEARRPDYDSELWLPFTLLAGPISKQDLKQLLFLDNIYSYGDSEITDNNRSLTSWRVYIDILFK